MKPLNILHLFILLIFSINVKAQEPLIDSLKIALKKAKHDTTRCNILNLLSDNASENEWSIYNDQLLKLSEKSAVHASPALKPIYLKYLGIALNNAGYLATNQGDIPKALENLHRSLKIEEQINDKKGMSSSLINIGFIYDAQGDYVKALEYYQSSLILLEEINDEAGLANCLNNIGLIYKNRGDIEKALTFFQKSLKIREKVSDKSGISNSLNNIGLIYYNKNNVAKALEFFYKSLKIVEEISDKRGIAFATNFIATALQKQGLSNEAQKYANRSLSASKEVGYPENIKRAAMTLKEIYKGQNNFKKAFEMYELEVIMRDSIYNAESKKASLKKQLQYQYEKKAAADSVKNVEEQKVKNALVIAQQAQLKQERTKSYALYGGLGLLLVFAGFMVNRFRVTSKQKQIIELKEIETQKQNKIITTQKHLVEEKHKEITDSINYAERIQRSFLATTELLDDNLKHNNYFVFFQPKDVVSGDFYWAASIGSATDKKFILVTADSTGHGVPGAIMSILNISCLEKAVEQEKFTEPAEILNHTRSKIIERLKKDGSENGGKDGMDCSLICFDFKNSKLTYAAANNPVWIIRSNSTVDGEVELIELGADKMPVGKHDKDTTPFTQHTFNLQKDDVVYTLTDGLPDQFGGLKGKKFMYKQLKELLKSISHLSMHEQNEVLKTSLNSWRGDLQQVDDICVIGIKI
ncbi:MAG: tetratricopeptide repeat protein [Bacteroidota bacterium]